MEPPKYLWIFYFFIIVNNPTVSTSNWLCISFLTNVVRKWLLTCVNSSYGFFPRVFINILIVHNFYFISIFVYSFSHLLHFLFLVIFFCSALNQHQILSTASLFFFSCDTLSHFIAIKELPIFIQIFLPFSSQLMSLVILAIENKPYDFKVYTAGSKRYGKQFAVSKSTGQLQIIIINEHIFKGRPGSKW